MPFNAEAFPRVPDQTIEVLLVEPRVITLERFRAKVFVYLFKDEGNMISVKP